MESVPSFGYTIGLALWLACVVTVSTGWYLWHVDRYNGPRPFPLIGNVGTFLRLRADIDSELIRIREKWGNICRLKFGNTPILIINDPRTAKELLNDVCCPDLTRLRLEIDLDWQRSAIYSSRPEPNAFRKELWPFRLIITPAGEEFRFLRKMYNSYLGPRPSELFRKYQDGESIALLQDLLDPRARFLRLVERYTMSVIFSAVYGTRVESLDDPLLVEFNRIWDIEMKCREDGDIEFGFWH